MKTPDDAADVRPLAFAQEPSRRRSQPNPEAGLGIRRPWP